MRHTLLREAIRRVLGAPVGFAGAPGSPARMTAMAALGLLSGHALAQDAPQDQNNQQLETITVTGSNIRRVDIETSNPVITIDRAAIQKTGKLTLGDLVQQLPAVTGPNTNPQINNGGGSGASSIGLRGLGSPRTLVLINGHRFLSGDPNAIPGEHDRAHRSADRRCVVGVRFGCGRRRRQLHPAQRLPGRRVLDDLRHLGQGRRREQGLPVHVRPELRQGLDHGRHQLQQDRRGAGGPSRFLEELGVAVRHERSGSVGRHSDRRPCRRLDVLAVRTPADSRSIRGSVPRMQHGLSRAHSRRERPEHRHRLSLLRQQRFGDDAERQVQLRDGQSDPDTAGAHRPLLERSTTS